MKKLFVIFLYLFIFLPLNSSAEAFTLDGEVAEEIHSLLAKHPDSLKMGLGGIRNKDDKKDYPLSLGAITCLPSYLELNEDHSEPETVTCAISTEIFAVHALPIRMNRIEIRIRGDVADLLMDLLNLSDNCETLNTDKESPGQKYERKITRRETKNIICIHREEMPENPAHTECWVRFKP